MRIAFGCDHGGFDLKKYLVEELTKEGHEIVDCGTYDGEKSVDYPDYAVAACQKYINKEVDRVILCCGTGIGISIAANKINGIRCALVHNELDAELTRRHNNANTIALGGRTIGPILALRSCEKFLATEFEGGRHALRIEKISAIEDEQKKL